MDDSKCRQLLLLGRGSRSDRLMRVPGSNYSDRLMKIGGSIANGAKDMDNASNTLAMRSAIGSVVEAAGSSFAPGGGPDYLPEHVRPVLQVVMGKKQHCTILPPLHSSHFQSCDSRGWRETKHARRCEDDRLGGQLGADVGRTVSRAGRGYP